MATIPYSRTHAFRDHAVQRPSVPLPGQWVDEELDDIERSIASLISHFSGVLDTSGNLLPGVVTSAALDPGLLAGLIAQLQASVDPAVQACAQAVVDAGSAVAAAQAEAADAAATASQVGFVVGEVQQALFDVRQAVAAVRGERQKAEVAATAATNQANHAWQAASLARLEGEKAFEWAEKLEGPVEDAPPGWPEAVDDGMFSSKWWAVRAAGIVNGFGTFWLGAHAVAPTVTASGGPLRPGSMYYDTVRMRPYVWTGTSWRAFEAPAPAKQSTLTYVAVAGQQEFQLQDLDLFGGNYRLSIGNVQEAVDVHLNGVRLVPDDGSGLIGDYEVDYGLNVVRLLTQLPAAAVVQIDVLTPAELIAPGAIQVHAIADFDVDWSGNITGTAGSSGLLDGARQEFEINATDPAGTVAVAVVGAEAELAIFIDGVRQRPGIDYSVAGSRVTFTVPPKVDSLVWGLWYEPGAAALGAGVSPPVPPLDQVVDTLQWVPGRGIVWVDSRAQYRVVANAFERLSIRDPEELIKGTLVLQADTEQLWYFDGRQWQEYLPAHAKGFNRQRLVYDPSRPVDDRLDWFDDRTALEVVNVKADLNDRNLLPAEYLTQGKLVFVRGESTLYQLMANEYSLTNTDADWQALVGGVQYVGRAANLPTRGVDGQLFVITADVAGRELNRLVAWDGSIPAQYAYVPLTSLAGAVTPTNIATNPVSPPQSASIQFALPPNSAIGQTGQVGFRLFWEEDGVATSRSFLVPVNPGDVATDVASYLASLFNQQLPSGEFTITRQGALLTLSPRAGVPPVAPLNDLGSINAVPAAPVVGDWAVAGGNFAIGGQPVAQDSTLLYVGPGYGFSGWIVTAPSFTGGTTIPVNPGGNPAHNGAQVTFAGGTNLNYFQGNQPAAGYYMIHTGGTYTFPAPDPQYPLLGNLAGQTIGNGDFIVATGPATWAVLPNGGADNAGVRAAYTQANATGQQQTYNLGGAVTPAPTPPASFQQPNTSPHDIIITNLIDAVVPQGPVVPAVAGGWRSLNRMSWVKPDRITPDQATDQRGGDFQSTIEALNKELKVYDPISGAWIELFTESGIKGWIASLSLFEGTVQEPGGGAVGAIEFGGLPDLAALSAAADLSDVSHYWTFVGSPNFQVTAATPVIGADLDGAILNPGDWIQVANRGGDGSGVGVGGGAPDLHWVTIGGDLLAKARADRLFGLQPWTQGSWEQGSLVVFQGDVYRAVQAVTATDPAPVPPPATYNLTGVVYSSLNGGPLEQLAPAPNRGDVDTATAAGVIPGGPHPFAGDAYVAGDSYVFIGAPFQGQGQTSEGYRYDQGWVKLGVVTPAGSVTLVPPIGVSSWQRIDISGGLKVASDDAALPANAPPGQVWIVLSSAQAGGKAGLFAYDAGALQWQQLGGGGTPLDLTGGTVIYPRLYATADDTAGVEAPALPAATLAPQQAGDAIFTAGTDGSPVLKAVSRDGINWDLHKPHRISQGLDGAGRTAKADYPTQLNIGMAGSSAKITHIADQNLNWMAIPEVFETDKANLQKSQSQGDFRIVHNGNFMSGMIETGSAVVGTYLTFFDSSMKGRAVTVSLTRILWVFGSNFFRQIENFNVTFDNNGYARFPLYYDAANRIDRNSVATFDLRMAQLSGNTAGFSAHLTYNRSGYSQEFSKLDVLGKITGITYPPISLMTISTDSAVPCITVFPTIRTV